MKKTTPTPAPISTAIPGGRAAILAEVAVEDDPAHGEIILQALSPRDGKPLVRIAYRRDGRTGRGPVSMTRPAWQRLLARAERDPILGDLVRR